MAWLHRCIEKKIVKVHLPVWILYFSTTSLNVPFIYPPAKISSVLLKAKLNFFMEQRDSPQAINEVTCLIHVPSLISYIPGFKDGVLINDDHF
jgi:hypothetical protein